MGVFHSKKRYANSKKPDLAVLHVLQFPVTCRPARLYARCRKMASRCRPVHKS